jgi:HSP20 family protein
MEKTKESTELARREMWWPALFGSPFSMMRQLTREMDRWFDEVGIGRVLPAFYREPEFGPVTWAPDVEVFEKDNHLFIRADLPGLTRDDVKVEVTEQAVTLQGERKVEREEKKEGMYLSERSYGSFYRCIALPEGVMYDKAKAKFQNGVLEVSMPVAPKELRRGKLVPIE